MAKVGSKLKSGDRKVVEVPHHGRLIFETFEGKGDDPGWYWRMKGGNGEIMAVSESYTLKGSAKRSMYIALTLVSTRGASIQTEDRDGVPTVTHHNLKAVQAAHNGKTTNTNATE